MIARFEHIEISMSMELAKSLCHQGDCDQDVKDAIECVPKLRRQLDKIPADVIRRELKQYGAWSEEELADEAKNKMRLVWIAAGDIVDEKHQKEAIGDGK